ncbi:uncharacterized protein [Primulina eburnea]|uniref:uncharacterized protein isoform X2 n=1 Tax=Primulina eburnea TaxID=1245227 RepID=UPI003C6C89D3
MVHPVPPFSARQRLNETDCALRLLSRRILLLLISLWIYTGFMKIQKPIGHIKCNLNPLIPPLFAVGSSSAKPFLEGAIYHVLVYKNWRSILAALEDNWQNKK